MKIERVFDPEIVAALEPHIIMHDKTNIPAFCADLVRAMKANPLMTFVLVGVENEKVKCFLIGADPGLLYNFMGVGQVWSHPENPWAIAEEMFLRVLLWAIAMGKTSIRAETSQTEAFTRRSGFVVSEQVVRYDITKDLEAKLFERSKEIFHG